VEIMTPILRDWDLDVLITHNRFTLVNNNAEPVIAYGHSKGIAVLNATSYASGVPAKGSSYYPRYVYQQASKECLNRLDGSKPFAPSIKFPRQRRHSSS
jgi:D-threo-aldose 1-dehydrogenase